MGTAKVPRNLKFPDDLVEKIEAAQVELDRPSFSDTVFHLVRLGLKRAAFEREAIRKADEADHRPVEKGGQKKGIASPERQRRTGS